MNQPVNQQPPSTPRRLVRVTSDTLVTMSLLDPAKPMPLLITPVIPGIDPVLWVQHNRPLLDEHLLNYGAVLLRGFRFRSRDEFETVAAAMVPKLLDYTEGSAERLKLSSKVYTSSEYPSDQTISMHNELSYARRYPAKLFFFCETAPETGGETPIADCRRVLTSLPTDVRDSFHQKGVRYVRNLRSGSGLGLSWQQVFETQEPDLVEEYCRRENIDFAWRDDGTLWTSQVRPGVITHPQTGAEVWFNQADQFHSSNLPVAQRKALLELLPEERLPINAQFGDGTLLDDNTLNTIRNVFTEESILFRWQEGDLLMVDNVLTAHGRRPFTGARRILVAMG